MRGTAVDAGGSEIGDIKVSGGVGGEVAGAGEGGVDDGGNASVGGDFADTMVAEIGHIEGAGGVYGEAVGEVELGECGGPAIAGKSGNAGAGEGGNQAVWGNAADTMGVGIGQIIISQRVDGDAFDGRQQRFGSRAAVADEVTAGNCLNKIGGDGGGCYGTGEEPRPSATSTHTNIVGIPSLYSQPSR